MEMCIRVYTLSLLQYINVEAFDVVTIQYDEDIEHDRIRQHMNRRGFRLVKQYIEV